MVIISDLVKSKLHHLHPVFRTISFISHCASIKRVKVRDLLPSLDESLQLPNCSGFFVAGCSKIHTPCAHSLRSTHRPLPQMFLYLISSIVSGALPNQLSHSVLRSPGIATSFSIQNSSPTVQLKHLSGGFPFTVVFPGVLRVGYPQCIFGLCQYIKSDPSFSLSRKA